MSITTKSPRALAVFAALLAGTVSGAAIAQNQPNADLTASVNANSAEQVKGPDVDGIISARDGGQLQITGEDGSNTVVTVTGTTRIRSSGGFLGLSRDNLAAAQLLNGLPVSVETVQGSNGLVASEITLKKRDLKTANMIHSGTNQRFVEQAAATEALRGRMGDIDKYNIKGTTNVHFDTGRHNLSDQARSDLCATANAANEMDNALLLVVGYTDSTGSEEVNQTLSEKRAASVVNFLQQRCGWKPYRMLSPTGMATADPLADNSTEEGKAQNRRVAVNVLVSKAVDGF